MNSSVYWISWLHLSAASHFWRKSTNHFWASINEKSLRLIDFLLEINVMFSSCVSVYRLNETDRGEEWPDTGYYKYFPKNWQNERNEARMKSMEWNRRKMNATFEFHFSCHSVTVICYLLCDSNWQLVDCFFFSFVRYLPFTSSCVGGYDNVVFPSNADEIHFVRQISRTAPFLVESIKRKFFEGEWSWVWSLF